MARASFTRRVRRAWDAFVGKRGFDAASWRPFAREARFHSTAQETLTAAPQIRSRARYFYHNEALARAAVSAIETFAVGAGPMPAHENKALVDAFTGDFWANCDADQRGDFGSICASIVRALFTDGECFVLLLTTADGLRLRLLPAEQIDESLSRDLGGGAFIASGIEYNSAGERVAYHIRQALPIAQFQPLGQAVRTDARDVLQIMRGEIGSIRGVSAFAPVLLRLADLGLLNQALLKGFQIAALHAGFLEDANGAAQLPFAEGEKSGDEMEVSMEPGSIRRLPSGYQIKFSNPAQAQQSVEFKTATAEEIAAGLGVPPFCLTGNYSRASFSSLRASLLVFKAVLESLQYNTLAVQFLTPVWRRFALTQNLRGETEGDAVDAEWRFPPAPTADGLKAAQETKLLLDAKLMSRREAIAQRGEEIERVDADIMADTLAAETANENEPDTESSNAE